MAQPSRKNIAYLTEQLPSLKISEAGDALWANLYFDGQRVAVKKVDRRIFELAETDYHKDILVALLDNFVEERTKAKAKAEKAETVDKTDKSEPKTVEAPAAKPAKKTTKKKAKA